MGRESLFWLALLTDVFLSTGEYIVICTISGTRHLSETGFFYECGVGKNKN
jgi:hypothetical protein